MKAAKVRKRPSTQRAVVGWMDDQLARNPSLARQVEARLAELRIEQDLARLRAERGLSQSQLARRLGVTQPFVAKIESGRAKNLELRTLVRYAAALGAQVRIAIEKERPRGRAPAPA